METLAAVLLYLEAINADNSYTFEEIDQVEDANQAQVEEVYNNEEELSYVKEEYTDDVDVNDDEDMVLIGPLITDDSNQAY